MKEWSVRKTVESGHAIVGVKEHKTAAQQVATFALSQEEEMVNSSNFLSEPVSCQNLFKSRN